MVAEQLARRWQLPRAKDRFRGAIAQGRAGGPRWMRSPAGGGTTSPASSGGGPGDGTCARPGAEPRVAILCPQTYMNDAGRSVGPARGAFKLPLDRVLVVHDEIDLPFGEIRTRVGGGLAGHNGLRSLARELGGADFRRVRIGVGRPNSTDPEIVAAYVLARFRESPAEVGELVTRACEAVERVVLGEGE
jgi:PTH1 family peptidyl-tRNA hydrolase